MCVYNIDIKLIRYDDLPDVEKINAYQVFPSTFLETMNLIAKAPTPHNVQPHYMVQGDTTASIFFIWLIDSAACGFNGIAGVILELPCFVYLGKISYGIYVYHLLVHYTINKIVTFLGLPFPNSIWIRFILYTVATIIVAVLSWQFLEKPINALKRNFEY